MTHHLKVEPEDLEAVVLCLTLGTLEAMRSGSWPLSSGIWTLGRPVFWEPLVEAGLGQAVMDVLKSADELDALEKLCGRAAADAALDRMIAVVRLRLAALSAQTWHATWATPGVTKV